MGCTRDMLATSGRIGCKYFERPHAINAVESAFS
jgi:hypothetical protein